MDIIETTGDVQFLPIGGEPLEGCECQGPFHEKGCPAIKPQWEAEELARRMDAKAQAIEAEFEGLPVPDLEWLKAGGLEDDLMSGIKRLADREAFLNTDTANPPGELIIEDVGPKR